MSRYQITGIIYIHTGINKRVSETLYMRMSAQTLSCVCVCVCVCVRERERERDLTDKIGLFAVAHNGSISERHKEKETRHNNHLKAEFVSVRRSDRLSLIWLLFPTLAYLVMCGCVYFVNTNNTTPTTTSPDCLCKQTTHRRGLGKLQ